MLRTLGTRRSLFALVVLTASVACSEPTEAFLRVEGPVEWVGAVARMEGESALLVEHREGALVIARAARDLPFSPFPHRVVVEKDGYVPEIVEVAPPADSETLRVVTLSRPIRREYDRVP